MDLNGGDIDFEKKSIFIKRAYQKIPEFDNNLNIVGAKRVETSLKTKNSKRIVPIVDILYNRLIQYKPENAKSEDFVFLSEKGQPLTRDALRHRLDRFKKKYNLRKISCHGFRHSFATLCAEKDVNLKTAQAILGHSDIGTTADIYMHVSMEQNKNAVEKLNELDFNS